MEKKVIKKGSYGVVSLVGESSADKIRAIKNTKVLWKEKIRDFLSSSKFNLNEISDALDISNNLILRGKILEEDIKKIPKGISDQEVFKLANIVALTIDTYHKTDLQIKKKGGISIPYYLGLVLSDFLEVLPRDVAAKILFAASNPDIAQTILKGQGSLESIVKHVDIQPHAVEATVLLPKNVRHEIFNEMVNLQPGKEGRANRFFGLIAINWAQRNSDYCGPILIYQNLVGEQASEKILEVQEDLAELGPMVRGESREAVS
ncbi:MAG: hypothetical protein Q8P10_03000 [bacterium]|nr:hypothetical protein [bacterium]